MIKHRKMSASELGHAYDYLVEQFNQEKQTARDGIPFVYYVGGGELATAPTAFLGKLGDEWGLQNARVSEDHFFNLGDGKHAVTGEELVKPSQGARVRMHELMVSAPKSLSLGLAAGNSEQHEEIITSLRESTADLLAYIEETLPLVRRRVDGEEVHEVAAGLLAMSFEHLTSRQTPEAMAAGLPLAPQWHNHLQLSNIALRQADKLAADGSRYGAVESFHLTKEQKLLDCLWQLGVKDQLEAKGYRVDTTREVEARIAELTGKSPEHSKHREIFLHGISDREVLLKHSPRAKQVTDFFKAEVEKLRAKGIDPESVPSQQLAEIFQRAKISGRMSKVPPAPDQLELWQAMLAEDGITADTLARAKELGPRDRSKLTEEFITRQALARLPEVRSVITWAELRAIVAEECLAYGTTQAMAVELTGAVWGIETALEKAAAIDRQIGRDAKLGVEQILALRVTQTKAKKQARQLTTKFSPELVVLTDASVTTKAQLAREREVVGAVGAWAKAPLSRPAPATATSPRALKALADRALAGEPDYDPAIGLSADQSAALAAILQNRVTVTQGEAGTGKTFVAKCAAQAWRESRPNAKVIALAVSKARVKKFGEETGADHSLVFEKLGELPMTATSDTIFLVDELAQVDTARLAMLTKWVGDATPGLVGIGDPAQLASIGAGRLFSELQAATGVEVPPITTIQRTKDPVYGQVWRQLRDPKQVNDAVAWLDDQKLITFAPTKEAAIEVALDQWEDSRRKAAKSHGEAAAAQARIITGMSNVEIDDLSRMAQLRLLASGELKGESVKVAWLDPANPSCRREFDLHQGDVVQLTKNFSIRTDGKRVDLSNGDVAMIRSVTQPVDGKTPEVELEVIRRGGNKAVTLAKPDQLAALRLHYAGHDFKVQGDSLVADPIYLDTPNATLESVYMANSRGKGHARTRVVAALDELVPEAEELRAERKAEGKTLDLAEEGRTALVKRWQRTIKDVPAITLARELEARTAEPEAAREAQLAESRQAYQSEQMIEQAMGMSRAA